MDRDPSCLRLARVSPTRREAPRAHSARRMPVLCPPNGELDSLPRVRSADCGAGGQDEGCICNEARLRCGGGLVIVDNATGAVIGSSRYYDWNPADESVVIGYTYLARAYWGGAVNGEVKRLMIAHAFRFARTVWFHVSPGNVRSQRALERIGARFDRREMVPVGGVPSARMIYRVDRA
ncbi:MAG: GNAT family N-acetyltransferase [Phycisphaera sp.]|nr:GNAT family N-acetyltransferase [Phycisphaera sp.]